MASPLRPHAVRTTDPVDRKPCHCRREVVSCFTRGDAAQGHSTARLPQSSGHQHMHTEPLRQPLDGCASRWFLGATVSN